MTLFAWAKTKNIKSIKMTEDDRQLEQNFQDLIQKSEKKSEIKTLWIKWFGVRPELADKEVEVWIVVTKKMTIIGS